MKRKTPSSTGVTCVAKVPRIVLPRCMPVARSPAARCLPSIDSSSKAKRPKLSHKQMEDKANFWFLEYWLAQREQAPKPSPPPVSASDRKSALLARIAARNVGSCADGAAHLEVPT